MIGFNAQVQGDIQAVKKIPARIKSAMKKAQAQARDELIQTTADLTSQKYYISKRVIRQHTRKVPEGFKVSSKMLTLDKYKISPKRPGKRRVQIKAAVKRGALSPLGSRAFLMRSGGAYILMRRVSVHRLPVNRIPAPAIPQIVGNEETMETIEEKAIELITERMNILVR